jgi:hypothetical protein
MTQFYDDVIAVIIQFVVETQCIASLLCCNQNLQQVFIYF